MEDKCNTGGTRYQDKDGKELTEQEYTRLLKRAQNAGADVKPAPAAKDKEGMTDDR